MDSSVWHTVLVYSTDSAAEDRYGTGFQPVIVQAQDAPATRALIAASCLSYSAGMPTAHNRQTFGQQRKDQRRDQRGDQYKDQRKTLGQHGEAQAEQFLRAKGYAIVAKNYRSRIGEIDLIALHRHTLVFVEVRTLTGEEYGDPLATVTPRKQRQIAKTALLYLTTHNLHDRAARFDVIGIQWHNNENDAGGQRQSRLTHIEDAFELPASMQSL